MSNKRFTALPEKVAIDSGDYLAVDNISGGTKKFRANKILTEISEVEAEVTNLKNEISQTNSEFYVDQYELITTLNTGLSGLYLSDGTLEANTGFRRFYIPIIPGATYYLALSRTYSQWSYLWEFDEAGQPINSLGRVPENIVFTATKNTRYIGFAVLINGFTAASLKQKSFSSDVDERIQTAKTELSDSIFQTQGLVTTDYECITTLATGLNGFYESTGEYVSNSGWTRFYIPVNSSAEYTLTLDFNYNQYSYLCEFDQEGNYIGNHGQVVASKTFTVSDEARYVGFGCITSNLHAASLIQKIIFEKAEEKINRYRLGTFIQSAITYQGGYANYGTAFILQNALQVISPHMKIAVSPRAGIEYYVVWYDANRNFIRRSDYLNAEQYFSFSSMGFFRIGLRSEGEATALDPAEYDSYVDVYRFVERDEASGLCGENMPKVCLYGDFVAMTKDNSKNCDVVVIFSDADDVTGKAKIKWQGSSSVQFSKKNYTLTFYDSTFTTKTNKTIKEAWGAHSKYVLKANFIDRTMSKNVCCAKLYAAMLESRDDSTIKTNLLDTPNNGVIDGFPVKVYINDQYAGLYTFNLAKDEYLFGSNIKIFVDAEGTADTCRFRDEAIFDDDNWAVEYTDTEDVSTYEASFNQIYTICSDSTTYPDGATFKNAISQVVDIPSMIDKMIMITMCGMTDQESKNQMFGTYDGTKWFTTMYDMDTCFGFTALGTYVGGSKITSFGHNATANLLMHRLAINYSDEINLRYNALRSTVLSDRNLINLFRGFVAQIPQTLFNMEETLWDVPDPKNDTVEQIIEFLLMACKDLDEVAN